MATMCPVLGRFGHHLLNDCATHAAGTKICFLLVGYDFFFSFELMLCVCAFIIVSF